MPPSKRPPSKTVSNPAIPLVTREKIGIADEVSALIYDLPRLKRQSHAERGPLARGAIHAHRTLHSLTELPNDPQSHTEARQLRAGLDGALEALEDSCLIIGRNSRPAVRHTDHGALLFLVEAYSNQNRLIGSVFDGVRNEVVEDFLDRQTVARNDDGLTGKVEGEL